ncbi:MAG: hypothetical protein DMD90_01785 [Candidatus Rokuibacteriota bacterium]|nr:MAG: hypothetical protein DMD90_01785 [Candidatus Rokubacteria bacterium]
MKPTVLIADDDPQLLAMLEEVLSKDFTVITARSGASALTQFGRNAVDIVLTDLAMPSFNGPPTLASTTSWPSPSSSMSCRVGFRSCSRLSPRVPSRSSSRATPAPESPASPRAPHRNRPARRRWR